MLEDQVTCLTRTKFCLSGFSRFHRRCRKLTECEKNMRKVAKMAPPTVPQVPFIFFFKSKPDSAKKKGSASRISIFFIENSQLAAWRLARGGCWRETPKQVCRELPWKGQASVYGGIASSNGRGASSWSRRACRGESRGEAGLSEVKMRRLPPPKNSKERKETSPVETW